ncbi:hypothetical protein [uncultured Amnibacterium sp.]|uniref:hypothetical protein n=1 Tax=uncultured Amnibacterium sp. TaxID=1631851 RepID=UPI0035C97D2F
MVLTVVIGVVVAWFVVALALAMLIGRAAALGERHHRRMVSTRPVLESVRRTAEFVV